MITEIPGGGVTSPKGFIAGATAAGIKYEKRLDLGILCSEHPCAVAGLFTRNAVQSAPVQLSARRVARGASRAVVVNSGCANACTGERGYQDAECMTALVAGRLGLAPDDVLIAGTGVIGTLLPLERVTDGIERIVLHRSGGDEFARAIMTTDTKCKQIAVRAEAGSESFTIGAAVKGSGMIHPNMGTMLCFITTDASVTPSFLRAALARCVDRTFNMVSIDGDTSPSDTVVLFANGVAGNAELDDGNGATFEEALGFVCESLAKQVAADGEGATKLLEVHVTGALSVADARIAARTIAGSALVKAAMNGADPNWGRVVCAAGRSGAVMKPERVSMTLCGEPVMSLGMPVPFDECALRARLAEDRVCVSVDLGLGESCATAWGCDLSHEYVTINASYTT